MDFRGLVKEVENIAKEMNYPMPTVVINNRFKARTYARAWFERGTVAADKIEFNKVVFKMKSEDVRLLIIHEMFHLFTQKDDRHPEFKALCAKHNIPLTAAPFSYAAEPTPYRYFLTCRECGQKSGYKIKSKTVKAAILNPHRIQCGACKAVGKITVRGV